MKLLAVISVFLFFVNVVYSYPNYATRIPNGANVTSPCNSSDIWQGVGHWAQQGGGERNPFGKDFAAAGRSWTGELCKKDSDGDGRSNGEELGDPNCVWSPNATPERTSDITHPGICEPVNSDKCKQLNGDFTCPKKFECDAINEPGVVQKRIVMTQTEIPSDDTSYYCQSFDVSDKQLEHGIASYPVVDNQEILHHMIIYGCAQAPPDSFKTPRKCGMGVSQCVNLIDLWGFGQPPGNCYPKEAGAPFGIQGYRYVVLQVHWNNPARLVGQKDGSGFTMYMSPKLRDHNTGVLMYGQMRLELPPRQSSALRTATCHKSCSQTLLPKEGYKIVWGTLHMHLLGTKGKVELRRNGKVIKDLMPLKPFDYNNPVIEHYDPPVEYLPGDEIYTECHYNTEKQSKYTFYGDGTYDEMCFVFFQYYPHNLTTKSRWPNVDLCSQWDKVDQCAASVPLNEPYMVDNCDMRRVLNGKFLTEDIKIGDIYEKCYDARGMVCDDGCLGVVKSNVLDSPCLKNAPGDFIKHRVNNNWMGEYYRWLTVFVNTCSERIRKEQEASKGSAGSQLQVQTTVVAAMAAVASVLVISFTVLLVVVLMKRKNVKVDAAPQM